MPRPAADVPKNELARSKKLNKGKNPAKKAGVPWMNGAPEAKAIRFGGEAA